MNANPIEGRHYERARDLADGALGDAVEEALVESIAQALADAEVNGIKLAAKGLRAVAETRRKAADELRPEGRRRELSRVGAFLDAAELLDLSPALMAELRS